MRAQEIGAGMPRDFAHPADRHRQNTLEHITWLDRLEAEQGNLNSAPRWALARGRCRNRPRGSAAACSRSGRSTYSPRGAGLGASAPWRSTRPVCTDPAQGALLRGNLAYHARRARRSHRNLFGPAGGVQEADDAGDRRARWRWALGRLSRDAGAIWRQPGPVFVIVGAVCELRGWRWAWRTACTAWGWSPTKPGILPETETYLRDALQKWHTLGFT